MEYYTAVKNYTTSISLIWIILKRIIQSVKLEAWKNIGSNTYFIVCQLYIGVNNAKQSRKR